jgi:hypothetical protein
MAYRPLVGASRVGLGNGEGAGIGVAPATMFPEGPATPTVVWPGPRTPAITRLPTFVGTPALPFIGYASVIAGIATVLQMELLLVAPPPLQPAETTPAAVNPKNTPSRM